MKSVIVCDIDGVLADSFWRAQGIGSADFDWEGFYSKTLGDPALPLCSLLPLVDATVFLVTNRPESNRPMTEQWLKENGLWSSVAFLWMRPDDASKLCKMDAILTLVRCAQEDSSQVIAIFEDDPAVAIPLMRRGLPVVPIHSGYWSWPRR